MIYRIGRNGPQPLFCLRYRAAPYKKMTDITFGFLFGIARNGTRKMR
jgi:hypothetical protein